MPSAENRNIRYNHRDKSFWEDRKIPYGYRKEHAREQGMVSPPGGNRYIRNLQAEKKSPQDAPDAPEEQAAGALSGDWPQES
jgi:hypothetical protein